MIYERAALRYRETSLTSDYNAGLSRRGLCKYKKNKPLHQRSGLNLEGFRGQARRAYPPFNCKGSTLF